MWGIIGVEAYIALMAVGCVIAHRVKHGVWNHTAS